MTDLQQGAPPAPPAGWYPDPVRPGATRYWSGTGWTDQVSEPVAQAPFSLAPVALAPVEEPSYLHPAVAPIGEFFEAGPAVEPPPVAFATAPVVPEAHATQSEWHQTRARRMQRVAAPPVSTTTRVASSVSSRTSDPYDRNWVAGLAIAFAILSIPLVAARVLWELPPLTQSILAGAPVGVALLAFARAARHRSGRVLSIVALVISGATLAAAYLLPADVIRGIVDTVTGLLPA